MRDSSTPCTVKIAGIQVHYCDDDDKRHTVWVDLDKVKAIAWTDDKIGQKPTPDETERREEETKPHEDERQSAASQSADDEGADCDKIPGCDPPDPCHKVKRMMGRSLCWWDGRRWVCGEA